MGVVATLAALVLGLLVASARSTYGQRESEIDQITAYTILLDKLLAQYGDGAHAARNSCVGQFPPWSTEFGKKRELSRCSHHHLRRRLRERPFISRCWTFRSQPTTHREDLKIGSLKLATDLAQARFLLFSHLGSLIPFPFLAVLMLWMIILLAGFSLNGPCQRDNFRGASHLRTVSLWSHFSYSGTRRTILWNNSDQQRSAETCFIAFSMKRA